MYYLTNDMARQAQLAKPPYRNLEGYFEYKGGTTARIKEPSVEETTWTELSHAHVGLETFDQEVPS